MSKATKRKHVTKEVLEEYYVPEDGEEVAKIVGGRGNNLHEVLSSSGKQYLVSMPTKFRKNVWVKRGDYVVVSPIKEGVKVQGEIVYILYNKQIKYLKQEKLWPKAFDSFFETDEVSGIPPPSTPPPNNNRATEVESDYDDDDDDNDDDLFVNPNHRPAIYQSDDDSSDSDDDDCDDNHNEGRDGDNNVIGGCGDSRDIAFSEHINQMKISENDEKTLQTTQQCES